MLAGRQEQPGANMKLMAPACFKATELTAHFNSNDIDLYIAKLSRLNITDGDVLQLRLVSYCIASLVSVGRLLGHLL